MNYYECEMTDAKNEEWGSYSICVKGVRAPTPEEAEQFPARDMAALGVTCPKCTYVGQLTSDEAHDGSYDMSREDEFPIFGK